MKTSCECCAKSVNCPLQYDEERRAQCSILNADNEPLHYRNSEGYDENGAPVKYVVAEHPWLEDGDLRWASGEYLNFCHYFTSGEALLGAARVMHQTCL